MPYTERPEFYLVYNPSNFHTRYRHDTFEQAQAEAQHLSNVHGCKFHVLKALGRATPGNQDEQEASKKAHIEREAKKALKKKEKLAVEQPKRKTLTLKKKKA